jgi:predicted nucleic acid-binding protein
VSVVVDASITLSWRFDDEKTEATDDVLDHVANLGAIAPSLWRLEVANGLQIAVRGGRITPDYVEISLRELSKLPVVIDSETAANAWTATLSLARTHGLTLYDAAYLELAHRLALPLASLDRELRAAGSSLGLTLLGI